MLDCPECDFINKLFVFDNMSNREYWIMTEIFCYLHGGKDYCNYKKEEKMTKLWYLNRYVLQWFFVRLAKNIDWNNEIIDWRFIYWIMPLTGWGKGCIYLGKRNYKIIRRIK